MPPRGQRGSGKGETERDQVVWLVNKVTNCSPSSRDQESLKELLTLTKSSEAALKLTYERLMAGFKKSHSEKRLNTIQILDTLFLKSARIRGWLIGDLQTFVSLAIEADPLPPPRISANQMREEAIRALIGWNDKFSQSIPTLGVAYENISLKNQEHFEKVKDSISRREMREQDMRAIEASQKLKMLEKAAQKIREIEAELTMYISQANTSIDILLSTRDDSGAASGSKTKVTENCNNSDVIKSLDDALRMTRGTLGSQLRKYLSVFQKESPGNQDFEDVKLTAESLISRIDQLESRVQSLEITRIRSLIPTTSQPISDEDSEDDFLELPEKEGIEFMTGEDIQSASFPEPSSSSSSISVVIPGKTEETNVKTKKRKAVGSKLTSKKSLEDTSRSRLSKKIFKKRKTNNS